MAPSPTLYGSPEDTTAHLPSIGARPPSSRRRNKSHVMPAFTEEKHPAPLGARLPPRCEPTTTSVRIPDFQHNNGISRARTPAYMRTPARRYISSPASSGSPDSIHSGRKMGLTLPQLH